MVKLAVLALALTAGCQVRPSDRDVFYSASGETGSIAGSDAAGSGSDGAVEGPGSDASGSGSGSDAGSGSGSGSGSGNDGGTGGNGDGGDGSGTDGDGSNGGNGPGLGNRAELDDKTSFYACSAGGFTGALVPVGAVIALGLLRRRRRR